MDRERLDRLLADALDKVTGSEEEYLRFLSASAWNYKYSLEDRLLIYMQKPDAIACADADIWEQACRTVNEGAAGISVLRNGEVISLYDVSDTFSNRDNVFYLFNLDKENEADVVARLKDYVPFEGGLLTGISVICEGKLNQAMDIYMDDVSAIAEAFLRDSVMYMVCDRIGITGSEKPHFECIENCFSDRINIYAGLKACQAASEAVLRELEKAIRPYTKVPEEDKIRKEDYRAVSDVRLPAPDAAVVEYILSCDRFMINKNEEAAAVLADDTAASDAKKEFLKASYDDSYNMFYYLGSEENGYVGYKKENEGLLVWEGNYLTRSSERLLSWDEVLKLKREALRAEIRRITYRRKLIDAALGIGTHDPLSREKISDRLKVSDCIKDDAAFLKDMYGKGSTGFYFDNKTYCLSYDADGMYIAEGERTFDVKDAIYLSYEEAAADMKRLIERGTFRRPPTYISEDDLDLVIVTERTGRLFRVNDRLEERIEGLKKEYGSVSEDGLKMSCDDRGLLVSRYGEKPANCVFMPWEDVVHRIGNALKRGKGSTLDNRIESVQLELQVSEVKSGYEKER